MPGRIALAICFFALAPLLAIQAQLGADGQVPGWAEKWNGFRLSRAALGDAIEALQSTDRPKLNDAALEKARRAYSLEPLAINSINAFAIARPDQSAELLAAARSLNKRNETAGLLMLQSALQQADLAKIMSLVDELARVNPDLASRFVAALSQSLADERSIPILEQGLTKKPSWASAFWKSVPRDETSLANYLALRSRVRPPRDPAAERNLMNALVAGGQYAQAHALYEAIKASDAGSGDAPQRYPPFDWAVTEAREHRARLTSSGEMDIFVERGASGELARKLIVIEPGQYRLSVELGPAQGTGEVEAAFECAANADGAASVQEPARLQPGETWNVPAGSCRFGWLVLTGSAWNSSFDYQTTLLDASLHKLPT